MTERDFLGNAHIKLGLRMWTRAFTALILLIVGSLLLADGLFRRHTFRGTSITEPDERIACTPQFDRLVIMVVDALRADFLLKGEYNDNHPWRFVRGMIESGKALAFSARADSPTVTLPRIKALMTGTVPDFADVLFNYNGGALKSDNLLASLRKVGHKIVFYGDDTWIRLFPDSFIRYEGTTSFFVTDTVEVDNNVTRNVWPELERVTHAAKTNASAQAQLSDEWTVMILHYLGLDHIGHWRGPSSELMDAKQREMDAIIERIYKTLKQSDHLNRRQGRQAARTLVVLCSDHGMTDAGNHGGPSDEETATILVFLSELYEFQDPGIRLARRGATQHGRVRQADFAPTVALALGAQIPIHSVGTVIEEVFSATDCRYAAMRANALHLVHMLGDEANMLLDRGHVGTVLALQANKQVEQTRLDELTQRLAGIFSERCTGTLSVGEMVAGVAVMACAAGILGIALWQMADVVDMSTRWCQLLIAGDVLHWISQFASSFIEEEHQVWYFLFACIGVAFSLEQFVNTRPTIANRAYVRLIVFLISLRLLRGWNQTGVKWANLSGYADAVAAVPGAMPAVAALSLIVVTVFAWRHTVALHSRVLWIVSAVLIFLYKRTESANAAITLRAWIARSAYTAIAMGTVGAMYKQPQSAVQRATIAAVGFIYFSMLVHRERHIVLFVAMGMVAWEIIMRNDPQRRWATAVELQWAGRMAFFAMGNANHFAALDIGPGYTGLQEYNQAAVSVLLFLATYAGPLFFFIASLVAVYRWHEDDHRTALGKLALISAARTAFALSLYGVGIIVLRSHLFIWTVFSPKYLYELAALVLEIFKTSVMALLALFTPPVIRSDQNHNKR